MKKVEIIRYVKDGAILDNGKIIAPDLVVFATGFQQTGPFLKPEISSQLRDDKGMFQLYRNVLPADGLTQ